MPRRIFITGGTGFFGKSLLAAWRDQPRPECELTILSRNPERFLLKFPEFSALPHVRFLKGDVRNFTFPAEPFDEVIHAATPASATLEQENPEEMYSIIVDGTRHVIDFCRKSGVKRMLFTSSGAVYGPQEPEYERLAETHPCRPVTAYGKGKLAAEQLCEISSETHSRTGRSSSAATDDRCAVICIRMTLSAFCGNCSKPEFPEVSAMLEATAPYRSRNSQPSARNSGHLHYRLRFSEFPETDLHHVMSRISPGRNGSSD